MTHQAQPIEDFHALSNRPGMNTRDIIGSQHGVTSFFLSELTMQHGSRIPLHTHTTEEVFVVTKGALTLKLGEETVTAEAESVVRIPPHVPHAVVNDGAAEARAFAAGAWDRATWFTKGTTYLDGAARSD